MENIAPKDNCQNALDTLLYQMEQEGFDQKQLEQIIQTHPGCEGKILATYQMWEDLLMVEVPEPRAEMSANFYKKLNAFTANNQVDTSPKPSWWQRLLGGQWGNSPQIAWALGIGLFVFGFFSGKLFQPNTQQDQIDQLITKVEAIEKNQEFQLTKQQSVADRMKNIHLVRNMDNPNKKIINALNQALCNDPNVNVRLSAIESLLHFADDPEVMEILIKAIPKQNSSIVQLELAEVMLQLEEKRSAEAWKELLENGEVELDVKMQIEESFEKWL